MQLMATTHVQKRMDDRCKGGKDNLSETEQKVDMRLLRVTCGYRKRRHLMQNNYLRSCAVKPCVELCAECNDYL